MGEELLKLDTEDNREVSPDHAKQFRLVLMERDSSPEHFPLTNWREVRHQFQRVSQELLGSSPW